MSPELDFAETTQGAPGEPEIQEAGGSGIETGESQGTPNPDEEFRRRLEALDPKDLPDTLRQRLELPFLQERTRYTTEQYKAQQQLMSKIVEGLQSRGVNPTEEQRQRLFDQVRSGDPEAISQMVRQDMEAYLAPFVDKVSKWEAVGQASQLHPYVNTRAEEITRVISSDPELMRIANENGYKNAPRVYQAVALMIENNELKQQAQASKAAIEAAKKQAVEEYKRTVSGLPPTTTKAGSGSGKTGGTSDTKGFKAGARQTLIEMGLGDQIGDYGL